MPFVPDKPVHSIFTSETFIGIGVVLPKSFHELGSDTNVERAVLSRRQKIGEAASFHVPPILLDSQSSWEWRGSWRSSDECNVKCFYGSDCINRVFLRCNFSVFWAKCGFLGALFADYYLFIACGVGAVILVAGEGAALDAAGNVFGLVWEA